MELFKVSDGGQWTTSASPLEPTAATGGGVVWLTSNPAVSLSVDDGRSFTEFDPSTFFPSGGLTFCCDQVVAYEPTHNIFVWEMQYNCKPNKSAPTVTTCKNSSTGANRVRIAVTTPPLLRAHASNPGAAWSYCDFTPQQFGEYRNTWFDRSELTVGPDNVTWSVDTLRGKDGHSSLLVNFRTSELASGGPLGVRTPSARTSEWSRSRTTTTRCSWGRRAPASST